MQYRVVFEFQSEETAMSDVYNCKDEQSAKEKFAELKDSLEHAVGQTQCEVIDEPTHYSVINRDRGIYGYVRLLTE